MDIDLWILWLTAAGVLIVIELLTSLVATLCVAVGCIAAAVVALSGAALGWQLGAMAAGIVLAFAFLAPWINRIHSRRHDSRNDGYNSNMDALIGRETTVEREIPAGGMPGRVKVDGDSWQAVSTNGEAISTGTRVRVAGYDSIILKVEKL